MVGQSVARVDIPAKVTGGEAYVQDMRMPGMVHARIVVPPSPKATISAVDTAIVEKLPGVLKVHRDGNFLAVIAEREYQSVVAMECTCCGDDLGRTRDAAKSEHDLRISKIFTGKK